jgi:excisionase family DNA binding protein
MKTAKRNKPEPTFDPMLPFSEVARRLGVSGHMVASLVDAGHLHAFRPGPGMNRRVWESDLERFIQSRREKNYRETPLSSAN